MIEWWKAGPACRCPECGKGELFDGLLKFRTQCPSCGNSFADADAGDGPAVIVIAVAGTILVPILLVLMFGFHLSPLLLMLIMAPLTLLISIGLLRPFKSTLFALQRHNKAGEIIGKKNRDL